MGIVFSREYYGFVGPHSYLTDTQKKAIAAELDHPDENTLEEYERRFSQLVGSGTGSAFAAGRMAFYSLMKVIEVKEGDEVILLGFTCSVMPNAVLRMGAKPIYIDVDKETLGSLPSSIEDNITSKTKIIVAQHSFGIPCKINEIADIAKKHNIFLLEDCALSIESTLNDISVGNWGDAAIFSTDHTKPINTLIGGFLYSNNASLMKKVKAYQQALPDLSFHHSKRIFNQFIFEMKYFKPNLFGIAKYLSSLNSRMRENHFVFLEKDYSRPSPDEISYPYPAKFPSFLAKLGLCEIEHWARDKDNRIAMMNDYLNIIRRYELEDIVPSSYFSNKLNIIPHRFCVISSKAEKIKSNIRNSIDVDSIWFDEPIVCTDDPMALDYQPGLCQSSEKISKMIINFPTNVEKKYHNKLLNLFKKEMAFLSRQLSKNE
mgnify:CR=1 FL=1